MNNCFLTSNAYFRYIIARICYLLQRWFLFCKNQIQYFTFDIYIGWSYDWLNQRNVNLYNNSTIDKEYIDSYVTRVYSVLCYHQLIHKLRPMKYKCCKWWIYVLSENMLSFAEMISVLQKPNTIFHLRYIYRMILWVCFCDSMFLVNKCSEEKTNIMNYSVDANSGFLQQTRLTNQTIFQQMQGEYKDENMREFKHSRRNATCLGNGKKKLLFVQKKRTFKKHISVKFIILCNNNQM
jgi:hypothetical protein